jgi:hypothetical protein
MPEDPKPYDELRKLEAETRKLEAEARKLEAEAKDLSRTPWERPGTWVALGSAVIAMVAGLITIPTGYFSRLKTIADQQEKISKQAVEAAETRRELSQAQRDRLDDQVVAGNRQLEQIKQQQRQWLEEFRRKEVAAQKNLAQQQAALRTAHQEELRLQRDIALAPFKETLARLERTFTEHESHPPLLISSAEEKSYRVAISRMLDDLKTEVRQEDASAPAKSALLNGEIVRASARPLLSGLLLHALYQARGDPGLRERLFGIAENSPFVQEGFQDSMPSLPLELVLAGQYDDRDKARLTCRITGAVVNGRLNAAVKAGRLYVLAAQDPKVLEVCPDPFVKAVQTNRDLARGAYLAPEARAFPSLSPAQHFRNYMSCLVGLSTQAASVCLADLKARTKQEFVDGLFLQFGGESMSILSKPRYLFLNKYENNWAPTPTPFGRTRDLMRTGEWTQWLAGHNKLAALWLEPDLGTLTAHPELLKKAVRGVWLEESEIPDR